MSSSEEMTSSQDRPKSSQYLSTFSSLLESRCVDLDGYIKLTSEPSSFSTQPASIVSYNHLGNNDGKNLSAPKQFRSKEISKSNVVDDMVESNGVLYKKGEHPDHTVSLNLQITLCVSTIYLSFFSV